MTHLQQKPRGGQFLLAATAVENVFTPEDFNREHRMIQTTAREFVEKEVLSRNAEIENHGYERVADLLKQAGELGLLAHSVPEAYEGLNLDKITKAIVTEQVGRTGSYGVAHANHTGIATLPITYFGTPEQKAKYLPKLASGEYLGAYCLTEPSAGSDALGAKTVARLNEAGTHYVINGTKQFITNAGFSDTFIVYAKVDGVQFTAFIVEKGFPGLSLGPEEHKMGLHGSSTRPVIFEDCLVPVENVLGEIGKGHQIAFNVLNIGRFNLCAAALGGTKDALTSGIQYAKSRVQFGQPLTAMTHTQEKIARMAGRVYATESLLYRTAGLLDGALHDLDQSDDRAHVVNALMEYAIECSICKVVGSDVICSVVDDALQLHGGYGYIAEYRIEQAYRDARPNRIYEGTNEVNRLLVPGLLAKKAAKGDVPLRAAIEAAVAELQQPVGDVPSGVLGREQAMLATVRRVYLALSGLLDQTYGEQLAQEQEIVMGLSDIAIALYCMESAVLRAVKAAEQHGVVQEALKIDLATSYVDEVFPTVELTARRLLHNVLDAAEGALYQKLLVRQFTAFYPEQPLARNRRLAAALIDAEKYIC